MSTKYREWAYDEQGRKYCALWGCSLATRAVVGPQVMPACRAGV
jgi:hypothetical protein